MPTPLLSLARLAESLEATSSRRELARLIADFVRLLPADEVRPAVLLLIGRAFPERRGRSLGVGGASLLEAVQAAARAPAEADTLATLREIQGAESRK